MLTKNIINTVKAINALYNQILSIERDRDDLIASLKKDLENEACLHTIDELYINSFDIADKPFGKRISGGGYVYEKCDDSLFNPDSGSGVMFWPIEEEDKWLKIEYIW